MRQGHSHAGGDGVASLVPPRHSLVSPLAPGRHVLPAPETGFILSSIPRTKKGLKEKQPSRGFVYNSASLRF